MTWSKLWRLIGWPVDDRSRCPVVEGGDGCPWLASVEVRVGDDLLSPATVRLCHWHSGQLMRQIGAPRGGGA